jgi:hypothetical protein
VSLQSKLHYEDIKIIEEPLQKIDGYSSLNETSQTMSIFHTPKGRAEAIEHCIYLFLNVFD